MTDAKRVEGRIDFASSHQVLMKIVSFLSSPKILVERGAVDDKEMDKLLKGSDVITTYGNNGIKTLSNGLPQELINKVVDTFCDSHKFLYSHLKDGKGE